VVEVMPSTALVWLLEGVEHVEGSGEYKQPLAEGDGASLAAILNAPKAVTRAATEMNDPEEVQRIIRQQKQARDFEPHLNKAMD
jgi:hypothetical protein